MSRTLRLALLPLALAVSAPSAAPAQPEETSFADERPSLDPEQRARLHEVLSAGESFKARIHAAMMLGRAGTADEDLDVLARAVEDDPHYTVRGAAAMAIGNLGEPRGVEALLTAFGDTDLFVRKAAKEAAHGLAVAGAVPYLIVAREREHPLVRVTAVYVLADIDHAEARTAIAAFLGDPDPAIREVVEELLSEWPAEERASAVLAALEHPSYRVRAHAARIAALHPDARFVDPLVALLAEPLEEASVQIAASKSLTALRDYLDTEDLVKRVQGLVERDARQRAILLLGVRGGPRAVDVLIHTLEDPDVGIRGYAVMALGRAGDVRAGPHLQRLAGQPENRRISGVIRAALQDLSRQK